MVPLATVRNALTATSVGSHTMSHSVLNLAFIPAVIQPGIFPISRGHIQNKVALQFRIKSCQSNFNANKAVSLLTLKHDSIMFTRSLLYHMINIIHMYIYKMITCELHEAVSFFFSADTLYWLTHSVIKYIKIKWTRRNNHNEWCESYLIYYPVCPGIQTPSVHVSFCKHTLRKYGKLLFQLILEKAGQSAHLAFIMNVPYMYYRPENKRCLHHETGHHAFLHRTCNQHACMSVAFFCYVKT